jgi:hypothetical protein
MLILKTRSRIAVADINFVNRKSKRLTALLLLVRALVLSRWMQLVHVPLRSEGNKQSGDTQSELRGQLTALFINLVHQKGKI